MDSVDLRELIEHKNCQKTVDETVHTLHMYISRPSLSQFKASSLMFLDNFLVETKHLSWKKIRVSYHQSRMCGKGVGN